MPNSKPTSKKEFHDEEHEVFTYEDLKRGYFRLLADNMISEIVPHAVYDSESDLVWAAFEGEDGG